jgi:hypothetical protein
MVEWLKMMGIFHMHTFLKSAIEFGLAYDDDWRNKYLYDVDTSSIANRDNIRDTIIDEGLKKYGLEKIKIFLR